MQIVIVIYIIHDNIVTDNNGMKDSTEEKRAHI